MANLAGHDDITSSYIECGSALLGPLRNMDAATDINYMRTCPDYQMTSCKDKFTKIIPLYKFFGESGHQWFVDADTDPRPKAATLFHVKMDGDDSNLIDVARVTASYYFKFKSPRVTNLVPPALLVENVEETKDEEREQINTNIVQTERDVFDDDSFVKHFDSVMSGTSRPQPQYQRRSYCDKSF